jgi:hypothetical protein
MFKTKLTIKVFIMLSFLFRKMRCFSYTEEHLFMVLFILVNSVLSFYRLPYNTSILTYVYDNLYLTFLSCLSDILFTHILYNTLFDPIFRKLLFIQFLEKIKVFIGIFLFYYLLFQRSILCTYNPIIWFIQLCFPYVYQYININRYSTNLYPIYTFQTLSLLRMTYPVISRLYIPASTEDLKQIRLLFIFTFFDLLLHGYDIEIFINLHDNTNLFHYLFHVITWLFFYSHEIVNLTYYTQVSVFGLDLDLDGVKGEIINVFTKIRQYFLIPQRYIKRTYLTLDIGNDEKLEIVYLDIGSTYLQFYYTTLHRLFKYNFFFYLFKYIHIVYDFIFEKLQTIYHLLTGVKELYICENIDIEDESMVYDNYPHIKFIVHRITPEIQNVLSRHEKYEGSSYINIPNYMLSYISNDYEYYTTFHKQRDGVPYLLVSLQIMIRNNEHNLSTYKRNTTVLEYNAIINKGQFYFFEPSFHTISYPIKIKHPNFETLNDDLIGNFYTDGTFLYFTTNPLIIIGENIFLKFDDYSNYISYYINNYELHNFDNIVYLGDKVNIERGFNFIQQDKYTISDSVF